MKYLGASGLTLLAAGLLSAATPEDCHTLKKHGRLPDARTCYQSLLTSRDPAVRAEGNWGTGNFKQALTEFDAAISASPKNANLHVREGMLFHERFNNGDAEESFGKALEIDEKNARAMYGMALLAADGYSHGAVEWATKAIEADPKLVEAYELLANVALENSQPDKAIERADEALKLSAEALDAMAVRAAVEVLADRSPDSWLERLHKINPAYGEAESLLAHHLVINRRYEEGIAFYRKAIEIAPRLWSAHSELGMNLMRVGKSQEAHDHLQLAFDNGFTDAATTNSINLLNSFQKNFVTFQTPTYVLKLDRKEADLLKPYFEGELKRAIATYDKKYKLKLPDPVQLEVFPNHPDFEVRTMGLPGIGGILGVTFGEVVAMDSPSARKPGSFHWDATMWHELSHVYVLTATKHRVPRWFTEGLAVHEESAAAPEWGDRITPDILVALKDKKLLPVADLDRGFIRPTYPGQVLISYFQAGRICDYINGRWGWDKLLSMIQAFGQLKTTPQVIQEQLGMSPEEFDKQFLAWLDNQLGTMVSSFDDWRKGMKEMAEAFKAKEWDKIIAKGGALLKMYPDFVEAGSGYEILADAYLQKGDKANCARVLADYSNNGGRNPDALKKLASLQEELGRPKEAAVTLDRLTLIYPMNDEELHRRLGNLWLTQGNIAGSLREFGAAVASRPADRATAHYNLARALQANQQPEQAKEQLFLALEVAPNFRPAQKLLLEIEDSRKAK